MANEHFQRSLDHEDAIYGARFAVRREVILAPVSAKVEYFHFMPKQKGKTWRTG